MIIVAAANYTQLYFNTLFDIFTIANSSRSKQIRTRTVLEIQRLNKRC